MDPESVRAVACLRQGLDPTPIFVSRSFSGRICQVRDRRHEGSWKHQKKKKKQTKNKKQKKTQTNPENKKQKTHTLNQAHYQNCEW